METKLRSQMVYWEVILGTGEGVGESGKKAKAVNGVLKIALPLQVTGELCRTYFKIVPPKGKVAGRFLHQLPPLIVLTPWFCPTFQARAREERGSRKMKEAVGIYGYCQ